MKKQLILGTAQFGDKYGFKKNLISNNKKKIDKILHLAINSGIKYLDTAQTYGKSENYIGLFNQKKQTKKFKLITKLSPIFSIDKNFYKTINSLFSLSLERLRVKKIDIFFIHDFNNLKKYKLKLIKSLLELKKKKLLDFLKKHSFDFCIKDSGRNTKLVTGVTCLQTKEGISKR